MKEHKTYTVWVGGVEVNDVYLTRDRAENLATEYKAEGYDDVVIEKVSYEEQERRIEMATGDNHDQTTKA